MIDVRFRRFSHAEDLQLPAYHSEDAAGLDLIAAVEGNADVVLQPGARALIPTGLAIELPKGYEFWGYSP